MTEITVFPTIHSSEDMMNPKIRLETINHGSQGMTRRQFARAGLFGLSAMAWGMPGYTSAAAGSPIKMYKNLGVGHIGVNANLKQAIAYASRFGFEGVNPEIGELEKMTAGQRKEIVEDLTSHGLKWGAGGLPVQFREGEEPFQKDMALLPGRAQILREVGVTRVATWILPGHATLTYRQNFEQHRARLAEAAKILQDHGIRLGLEFVGPRTFRNRYRFPFISSQPEMLELCGAIGTGNVGLLLDAWHWHTSHGTPEELRQLSNEQIIEVHINDAPEGVPIDELVDNRRKLPRATGVIDLKSFMNILVAVGYDGPVTIEPFDDDLRKLDNEPALEKTSEAMRRAFDLIEM